jgi:hypothetical protein
VRRWNGWGAAAAKSAAAELLAKKLVVEGKRAGSGREVFLPGAWDAAARVESWKHGLYLHPRVDSQEPLAPPRPHHLLFAEAWRRIDAGDVPQLEQVRR